MLLTIKTKMSSRCRNSSLPSPLVKPLDDNNRAVALLAEVTNRSVNSVRRRLYKEEICPGSTVSRDFRKRGLTPHLWSDEVARFYNETDAFLYDSLTWNRNPFKLQMRTWIGQYLSRDDASGLDILCIGDGLGFDSAYLAQLGHRVTYFEVPGYSEAFARRLFEDSGYRVQILTDADAIPKAAFDVVVCLDVLEHVPDPSSFLAVINSYLRPGGRAIVHAPFYSITQYHLSHLKSNRQYSGNLTLFAQQGLALIDGQPLWNPIVLRKLEETVQLPSQWNLHLLRLRLMGLCLAVGRFWQTPFAWGDRFHRRPNPTNLVGLRPPKPVRTASVEGFYPQQQPH